jgi:hypothetical protein
LQVTSGYSREGEAMRNFIISILWHFKRRFCWADLVMWASNYDKHHKFISVFNLKPTFCGYCGHCFTVFSHDDYGIAWDAEIKIKKRLTIHGKLI